MSKQIRSVRCFALAALASTLILNHAAQAADVPATEPAAAVPSTPAACTSTKEFRTTDCPLSWHGVTLYGAYDIGVGWVSHG